jgi:hypothetical protein
MTSSAQWHERWPNGGWLTERWREPIKTYAQWVPIDFLLAWIDVESGGQLDNVSEIGERSLFQIHPDEQSMLNIPDADFQALTTNAALSLKYGVMEAMKYATYAKRALAAAGVEWHGRDFWKMTKLFHGAFSIPSATLQAFKTENHRGPVSWDELQTWALNAAQQQDPVLTTRVRALIPKTFANAQKTGEISQVPAYDPTTTAAASSLFRAYGLMI